MGELRWRRARENHAEFRAVDHLVGPGRVAMDIGASEGVFTRRMLKLVGREGRVHAFEPNPVSVEGLRKVRSNRLEIHPVGLSDSEGTARLRVPLHGDGVANPGMGSLERPEGKQDWEGRDVDVRIARLADEVSPTEPVHFMKIDVEGHEHAALEGGIALLEAHHPAVLIEIEERHRTRPVQDTLDLFASLGYDGYAFFGETLKPLSEFDVERDQTGLLGESTADGHVPPEYVHNFLFVAPGTDVGPISATT